MELPTQLWVINAVMVMLTGVGAAVGLWMVTVTARREHLITADARANEENIITVRRAARLELAFFLIHAILFLLSLWGFARVLPETPRGAIAFFFGTQAGRSAVSIILILISVLDLRDRRRLIVLWRSRES